MKNLHCFLLLYLSVLLLSCTKALTDLTDLPEDTYLIKTVEYKTKVPLQGVKISLYRCSNYDAVFGCQSTSLFATHVTDGNGEYTISSQELNKSDEGIVLSKAQYWDIGGGTGENQMEPEALAMITLTSNKSYPDTSIFALTCTGELGVVSSLEFAVPKDSTIRFRIFGNETNDISWTIYTKDSKCYQYCIIDTLNSGKLSLQPKKFETVNSSIAY